jgi:hypothetical protein
LGDAAAVEAVREKARHEERRVPKAAHPVHAFDTRHRSRLGQQFHEGGAHLVYPVSYREAGQEVGEVVLRGFSRPNFETPQSLGDFLPKEDSDVYAGLNT